MKIVFDRQRCTGHGRCYSLAPELFEEDDEGYCVVLDARPGADLFVKARSAVDNCPEQALMLEDVGDGPVRA